jgi:hypothetical protein
MGGLGSGDGENGKSFLNMHRLTVELTGRFILYASFVCLGFDSTRTPQVGVKINVKVKPDAESI